MHNILQNVSGRCVHDQGYGRSCLFLDMLHSSFILASLFDYFITYFGEISRIDHIPWSIAFTVVVTAIQTFLVHCFFSQKILKSSKNNWYLTGPIVLLALLRLFAASVSTIEMVRLQRYSAFVLKYPGWVFTTGLSLSSAVDVIITVWLCIFLRKLRTRMAAGSSVMIRVVDSLTLYTLENGALTCFATTASLICWLIMPTNLVFLGLHFIIGKLYANSLLAALNTRQELRQIHTPRSRSYGWRNANSTISSLPNAHKRVDGADRVEELETITEAEELDDPIYTEVRRRQRRRQSLIMWRAPSSS